MAEITFDPHTHAMSCLYEKVIDRASGGNDLRDIPKEKLASTLAQVIREDLRLSDVMVDKINTSNNSTDKLPADIFIHLGIANKNIAEQISKALMERFAREGRSG